MVIFHSYVKLPEGNPLGTALFGKQQAAPAISELLLALEALSLLRQPEVEVSCRTRDGGLD